VAKNNFDIDAIIARGITNLDTNTSTQPTGEETWTDYGIRNLAKVPTQAYKLARSGLGVGNIAELGARKLGAPEAVKKGLELVLPTTGQAEREAKAGYEKIVGPEKAKYLTESRPEDWGAEFLITEAPFIAASGGLGSLKGLGKALASSAGLLGGSIAGQKAGGLVGEYLGDEEVGEAIGGIAGGFGGLKATHRVLNKPSDVIGHKVEPAQRAKFEKNRTKKLAELEKEYGPKLKNMSEVELSAALQSAREQDAFNKAKTDQIKSYRDEIKAYDNKIDTLKAKPSPETINEYHKLKEGRKDFIKERNEKISEISKERFPLERKAILEHEYGKIKDALKSTNKEYSDAVKALGKDSYENLVKSKGSQEKMIENVIGAAIHGAGTTGLAGLLGMFADLKFGNLTKGGISALLTSFASKFHDEFKLARNVMKEHPELYKEYADVIKNADKWNNKRMVLALNSLGKKIDDYDSEIGAAKPVDLAALGIKI
jgi:hypothetical protein